MHIVFRHLFYVNNNAFFFKIIFTRFYYEVKYDAIKIANVFVTNNIVICITAMSMFTVNEYVDTARWTSKRPVQTLKMSFSFGICLNL